MTRFEYACSVCGEVHRGMPSFGAPFPELVMHVPEVEREQRVITSSDDCVVDNQWFFVRGTIEIAVHGYAEPFAWLAWVSLSAANYAPFVQYRETEIRSHIGPFFGWLSSEFPVYGETCLNLKTMVHLRDNWLRPRIEVEPTAHPLALEQANGMSPERLVDICTVCLHPDSR